MSTINSDVNTFVTLAQAYAAANNGHITASEIAFWDEVWFHNLQDFSLAVYLALPQSQQSLAISLIQSALAAPDHYL